MPYLGNSPASNFASVTKDTFSGDGSTTAFTLSKAATTNGVAVFVENVRQEPTTAYAVSGTTLTFTAAPVSASGNNIYVLHHNTPASTATHPSAQALTATSGTFSGVLKTDDTTDATSTTDGSLQTDGGLSVAKDAVIGDDLTLKSDSSVLAFGADADVKLTHVADTGLILAAGGQTTSDFGTPANGMKDFVIGGDGNVGMSILTTANNNVRLAFGDVDDPDEGQLNYDCNAGTLQFQIDGDSAFKMHNLPDGTFLAAKLEAQGGASVADEASVTFRAAPGIVVVSNRTNGSGAAYYVDYINSSPVELADPNTDFRNDDADGFICVIKSSNSYDISIKNRAGATKAITAAVFSIDF